MLFRKTLKMQSQIKQKNVLENLPEVQGRYKEGEPLGKKSWFSCGGSADVLYKPDDLEDLQTFLKSYGGERHIFGVLSNSIIRDGGLSGVTIRLGRAFASIETDGDIVKAGALALDANVARVAAENGIAGLEFFSGIPGSIGGALKMNAGCYGTETKDILVECEVLDDKGNLLTLTPDQMGMSYRHTEVSDDFIFISATFKGKQDNSDKILQNIEEIKTTREGSQPIREKTGGSTFANPHAEELSQAGLDPDTKVWQLIDKIGGRGLMVGGAQMSEKHCNFMINTGDASATDLENLGEEIRKRVLETFGLTLRWEIKRIGRKN